MEEGLHQALMLKFSLDSIDMQEMRKLLPIQLGTQDRCLIGWLARSTYLGRKISGTEVAKSSKGVAINIAATDDSGQQLSASNIDKIGATPRVVVDASLADSGQKLIAIGDVEATESSAQHIANFAGLGSDEQGRLTTENSTDLQAVISSGIKKKFATYGDEIIEQCDSLQVKKMGARHKNMEIVAASKLVDFQAETFSDEEDNTS
ncbi:hypothetical protein K7X08_000011 [Anisodus acutangulus]|uniref:Uncharacterized protein n=1 Tax=Anisodus acutangulus TaxID=402998 RepID=A0A9Q1LHP4_9SOLA|nr:hypothetical protein K7X08_000011 [Anisodus acutangulus]